MVMQSNEQLQIEKMCEVFQEYLAEEECIEIVYTEKMGYLHIAKWMNHGEAVYNGILLIIRSINIFLQMSWKKYFTVCYAISEKKDNNRNEQSPFLLFERRTLYFGEKILRQGLKSNVLLRV